ncbi:hypothetical protein BJF82_16165, partial [Kytococcus sp. CUA-901]
MSDVEFYNIFAHGCRLSSASRDVGGTLPVAAVQFCPPVQVASAHGFYVYPPRTFALHWDGSRSRISWRLDSDSRPVDWIPLDGGQGARLPPRDDMGGDAVPTTPQQQDKLQDLLDVSAGPPFVSASPRLQDSIEITTGLIARTPPGHGLLVRSPVNIVSGRGAFVYDGFLETDWYRSYIPVVLRLTSTEPVIFHERMPMAHLQVMPYPSESARPRVVRGLDSWPTDVWEEFLAQRRQRNERDAA